MTGVTLGTMQDIQRLLATNPGLTADEKQLLVYLVWLLKSVDECERERILTRLAARLWHGGLDHEALMHELGSAIKDFEAVEAATG